jgi:ribosomal-protein-serine acetyltransferase
MFSKQLRPGLELKLLEERHVLEVYSVVDANRRYLRQWLPWVDETTSPEITIEFIRKSLKQFAQNKGFHAGIWYDGAFCGAAGFQPVSWLNRRAEIGYWIAEYAQGKGIMTDAVRALADHAFDEWVLNRVQIQCAAGNLKSQAIPRRLGFKEEGLIQQGQLLHGSYHDLVMFGMLRDQWIDLRR